MKELLKAIAIPTLIFVIGATAEYYNCKPVKYIANVASIIV